MRLNLYSHADIIEKCGQNAYKNGKLYAQNGNVSSHKWSEAESGCRIDAKVVGTKLYHTRVFVTWDGDLTGSCSCPVGWNCKHVAALLIKGLIDAPKKASIAETLNVAEETIQRVLFGMMNGSTNFTDEEQLIQSIIEKMMLSEGVSLPGALPTQMHKASPLEEWKLETQALLVKSPIKEPRWNEGIFLYLIDFEIDESNPGEGRFLFEPRQTRRLKSGKWSTASARFTLGSISRFGNHYPPEWVLPIDEEIADLVYRSAHDTWSSKIVDIVRFNGGQIMELILNSGRAVHKVDWDSRLNEGEPFALKFAWEKLDDSSHQLQVTMPNLDKWAIIPTSPAYYYDPLGFTAGRISQNLSGEILLKLLHMPPVRNENLEEVSRFLLMHLGEEDVPLPVDPNITRISESPTPKLTLVNNEDSIANVKGEIQMQYGPLKLRPKTNTTQDIGPELHEFDGKTYLVDRLSATEEAKFLSELELPDNFNFVGDKVNDEAIGLLPDTSNPDQLIEVVRGWDKILRNTETFTDAGWDFETADDFIFDLQDATDLNFDISDHEAGWFEVSFDLDYNGKKIPILPLVVAWLEQDDEDAPIIAELEPGVFSRIPNEVIQPITKTLLELYRGRSLDKDGRLRLAKAQAPWILAIDEMLAESGQQLSWTGGEKMRELAQKLTNFKGIQAISPPAGLNATLRDYQQEGLNWLYFLKDLGFAGILADDMGLGKTMQALGFLLKEKELGNLDAPTLVVAPTSVLGNWRREANKFAPALTVMVHHGSDRTKSSKKLEQHDIVITSYALILRDLKMLKGIKFHSLILDEAQAIKNPKAKVSQSVKILNAENKICLTGTPMENHLGELWSLFDFLMPEFLGTETSFKQVFRTPIEKYGKSGRKAELIRRISPFLLRRLKEDVADELPPKTIIIKSIEFGPAQAKLYESIRISMESRVRNLIQSKGANRSHIEMLEALLRLRQVCCDPRLAKMESALQVQESAKLTVLLEMLEEMLEEGRKILLFSQFTSMLSLIQEELINRNIGFVTLTGRTTKRDEVIQKFQTGEVPLFLISLKAGGTGLNLTEADTVIHYDPWWNPAVENQATDRAHRIGQDKPVFVYKLVTENTVEEKIQALQERKQGIADSIYGKDAQKQAASGKLSSDELISLFAPIEKE